MPARQEDDFVASMRKSNDEMNRFQAYIIASQKNRVIEASTQVSVVGNGADKPLAFGVVKNKYDDETTLYTGSTESEAKPVFDLWFTIRYQGRVLAKLNLADMRYDDSNYLLWLNLEPDSGLSGNELYKCSGSVYSGEELIGEIGNPVSNSKDSEEPNKFKATLSMAGMEKAKLSDWGGVMSIVADTIQARLADYLNQF